MFIYNLKLNSSMIFKLLIFVIILIVICLCIFIVYKLYKQSIDHCESSFNNITEITNQNYSNILQMVHNDLDSYIGQKIKYSGFIYRVYDLNQDQFILGRNMIISSDFQTVVIGFLSHYSKSIEFCDGLWVELEGTITKGNYHGEEIPILEITKIKEINKPNDEYVYPPDENYIPTSVIL